MLVPSFMIRAVLFDADGVLVHGTRFSDRFTREFGISMDVVLPFFTGPFSSCLIGKADLKQELQPFVGRWSWKGDVDALLHYWFEGESHVDTRVVALIRQLRASGVLCYLATNNEKYRTQFFVDQLGFGTLFDGVFSSAELGFVKPDRLFYEQVFSRLGSDSSLSKEEVLLCDDDIENVDGAKQYGFVVHHYIGVDGFCSLLDKHSVLTHNL
jgi:putative hydrolase of the HAD superfamily